MGQWARRRLRSTAPEAPAPPAPPLDVLAFFWDGGAAQYRVQFTGPITYDGSGTLGGVTVDGESPDIVTTVGLDSLQLHFPTASGPGTTWLVASQPPEISELINVPETGTT